MQITSIELHAVNLPFLHPASDSLGTYYSSNHCIVIVWTDSGVYGAGEIALAWFGGAHSFMKELKEQWFPLLIGEDCRKINHLMHKLQPYAEFSKRHLLAKAGLEMALYDVVGKSSGLPVYQLLGGKVRDSIKLTGGINMGSVDEMTETARIKVQEGYQELKIKVGADFKKDIAAVERIRSAIPDDIRLRIDANMSWSDVKDAAAWINAYFDYGVHLVEQPLAVERLEDLAWLRTQIKAKLLLDESVWDAGDAKRCLEAKAADLLHVYISEAGGLSGAKTIFELAGLYHVPCTIGSMPEARIGTAASLHLACAMNNLSVYASDIRGYTIYREDVVQEDFRLEKGAIWLDDRPGLGVTIDFDKLDQISIR